MRDIGGYRRKVYTVTMVPEFSRTPFEMHSTEMDQKATSACHVRAFRYFGAVLREDSLRGHGNRLQSRLGRLWKANKYLMRLVNH